jgi:AAA domain
MHKLELIEHIPGERVHTFLFTGDVKLTMADLKPTKWGDRRAKVEAWCGDTHACACPVTLGDPETGGKFVYYARQRVNDVDWYEALRLATGRIEADAGTASTCSGTTSSRRAEVVTMSDVAEEPIEWLWPPYIAIRKVCILDGDPGTGKSLYTVGLASTLSVGGLLPDQQGALTVRVGGPCDILLLALEDGLADTLKKRIRLCGGNDTRIHVLTGWRDAQDAPHEFTLQDMPVLEEAIQRFHPRLVVIDPIQAYLGRINMNRANEVQPLMRALARVAERYDCAVVCVRHPAKPGQGGGKVIHRGMGSVAFIGGVRTALFVEQHPLDKDKVLLCQQKSNVGTKGRTQVFSKAEGAFSWCGVSRLDAELLGGSGRGPEPHAFIGAACWLEAHMTPGVPMASKDIEAQMSEDGYSKDMIQRVKRALGIRSMKAGPGWVWTLPPLSTISTSTPTTPMTSTSCPTSISSTTSVSSYQLNTYGDDRQDVGELEEPEEPEDTEAMGVGSGGVGSALDPDLADVLGAVNVTAIDDEPPDDLLLIPRDPTAALSPAAQEARFTRRVQQLAETVRPTPSVSPSHNAPPAINEADAMSQPGDTTDTYEETTI